MQVTPEQYDNWYATSRGRWISEREFTLLMALLRPTPGASLLDIGCGTGHRPLGQSDGRDRLAGTRRYRA